MCIGQPLQVVASDGSWAWCADPQHDAAPERLDMALVGPQPAGTWVLAFQGTARQVMSDDEAAQARAGRLALAAVLSGAGQIDDYFADLVGRTPQLPEHLRPAPVATPLTDQAT